MSIQSELTRLTNAKAAIKTAIEGKGVTVPDGTLLDGMAALIESIEAGGGNIVAGSFTPTSDIKTYTVNHNFNTKDICFVVFMSANKNYVSRGIVHSSYTAGGKSWQVFNTSDSNFYSSVFGNASNPTITTVSVDLVGYFYNSVFISGSTYTYFVWKNGEI